MFSNIVSISVRRRFQLLHGFAAGWSKPINLPPVIPELFVMRLKRRPASPARLRLHVDPGLDIPAMISWSLQASA